MTIGIFRVFFLLPPPEMPPHTHTQSYTCQIRVVCYHHQPSSTPERSQSGDRDRGWHVPAGGDLDPSTQQPRPRRIDAAPYVSARGCTTNTAFPLRQPENGVECSGWDYFPTTRPVVVFIICVVFACFACCILIYFRPKIRGWSVYFF